MSEVKKKITNKKTNKKPVQKKDKITTKEKIKRFITSYPFLYSSLGILFVLVIVLAILVGAKSAEEKNKKANLVFSILEKGTRNNMNIDLKELSKKGEYTIKITNYRGSKTSKENIDYTITVRNDTKSEIKITKDDSKENLIVDQKATKIEGVKLNGQGKDEDVYYISVISDNGIKEGDKISLEIAS